MFSSVHDSFDDYQILERKTLRPRRSLIPVIGQLMSSLSGTVSEKDLENIDRNIRALEHNQREIIHDLDVSLSVLNLTRLQIAENGRLIMDLVIFVEKLDGEICCVEDLFEKKFIKLEQFIHMF